MDNSIIKRRNTGFENQQIGLKSAKIEDLSKSKCDILSQDCCYINSQNSIEEIDSKVKILKHNQNEKGSKGPSFL